MFIYYFMLILNVFIFISNCVLCGHVGKLVDSMDDKLIEMQFLLDRVVQLDTAFVSVDDS